MHRIGVYLTPRPNTGGAYRYWLAILKALSLLDRKKYDIYIYAWDGDWLTVAENLGIENRVLLKNRNLKNRVFKYMHRRYHCRLTRFMYKMFTDAWKQVRNNEIDLWLAQKIDELTDVLPVPLMTPIFDLMHRYERRFPEVKSEYYLREYMFLNQCRKGEILLADSEVGKKHIIESYGRKRKDLASHIKILPFIPPDYIYHYAPIAEFPYKIFDKYIFYPAQFWKHKNHEGLIEAMSLLKQKGVEINLVLVGSEKNNRGNVESLIREKNLENNVKILGYVTDDEIVYLYQHARALVMPTFFGPTNIPPLEAFALGCPVATSGIYGVPEQVGDAALLFDPNSAGEIANAIEKLWTDDELCSELICRGKRKADGWGETQFYEEVKKIIDEYFAVEELAYGSYQKNKEY